MTTVTVWSYDKYYYFVFLPDWGESACSATGNTWAEAVRNFKKVEKAVKRHYQQTGKEIPKPNSYKGGSK
jgi:predicted RNase H-like HicB family nuclease